MGDKELSDRDRNRLIEWGGRFLRTVSTRPEVMRELVRAGYSLEINRQGWDKYLRMLGGGREGQVPFVFTAPTEEVQQAQARMDATNAGDLRKAKAVIVRCHPELVPFLFPTFPPSAKGFSRFVVAAFLSGYDALRECPPHRPDLAEAFRSAIDLLSRLGLMTADRVEQLRADLARVTEGGTRQETVLMPSSAKELEDAAKEFRKWLLDWRFLAQQHVKRRDYRLMLGISRPRSVAARKAKTGPAPADA